jgi:hypothetical protein
MTRALTFVMSAGALARESLQRPLRGPRTAKIAVAATMWPRRFKPSWGRPQRCVERDVPSRRRRGHSRRTSRAALSSASPRRPPGEAGRRRSMSETSLRRRARGAPNARRIIPWPGARTALRHVGGRRRLRRPLRRPALPTSRSPRGGSRDRPRQSWSSRDARIDLFEAVAKAIFSMIGLDLTLIGTRRVVLVVLPQADLARFLA